MSNRVLAILVNNYIHVTKLKNSHNCNFLQLKAEMCILQTKYEKSLLNYTFSHLCSMIVSLSYSWVWFMFYTCVIMCLTTAISSFDILFPLVDTEKTNCECLWFWKDTFSLYIMLVSQESGCSILSVTMSLIDFLNQA